MASNRGSIVSEKANAYNAENGLASDTSGKLKSSLEMGHANGAAPDTSAFAHIDEKAVLRKVRSPRESVAQISRHQYC